MFDLPPSCRVLIQGIDRLQCQESYQLAAIAAVDSMLAYGTNIVAEVTAGRGGQQQSKIPVFDLVEQAQAEIGHIDVAIIFSSPWQVLDAVLESIAAGIERIIICSGGVPPLDSLELLRHSNEVVILGSGSAGMIAPDRLLMGSFDPNCFQPGTVGIISRSKSLACETADLLRRHQLGQSIVVHVGSDSILGSAGSEWLKIISQDSMTSDILLLGDIDRDEELLTIARSIKQQVIAYRPQLTSLIAPLSDAAMLLRAGRKSQQSQNIAANHQPVPKFGDQPVEGLIIAESIFALPTLLTENLSPKISELSPTSQGKKSPNGLTNQVLHG
jgi:succinyl-CoA synthetase alpha subunit